MRALHWWQRTAQIRRGITCGAPRGDCVAEYLVAVVERTLSRLQRVALFNTTHHSQQLGRRCRHSNLAVNKPSKPEMDGKPRKKSRFWRAVGIYRTSSNLEMVEPGGIEPPTSALRTRRSPS